MTTKNKKSVNTFIAVLYILGCMLFVHPAFTQNSQLKYVIMQGGSQIGTMTAQKMIAGSKTEFSIISEVKKRMVMMFEVYEKHTANFVNDIMSTATVFRKVNGKTKVDKQISCSGLKCTVTSEGKTASVQQKPVYQSVLNIYFFEPDKIPEIYSDNFQKMLALQSLGNHAYKLPLPDGNTVYYYYTNGICSKVKVDQKLYNLEFLLVQ